MEDDQPQSIYVGLLAIAHYPTYLDQFLFYMINWELNSSYSDILDDTWSSFKRIIVLITKQCFLIDTFINKQK